MKCPNGCPRESMERVEMGGPYVNYHCWECDWEAVRCKGRRPRVIFAGVGREDSEEDDYGE